MATSAQLANDIATYDKNRVTSADALNQALGQYGVPEIRKTVSGLRTSVDNTTNALNAVDPSVTGRTQGSLVTEAQRQRQVANERAPIAGQLDTQGRNLSTQQQSLQDALGMATTQASNRVNDYNTGRSALQSQYESTFQREQAAAAEAARQAAFAEQQRQFNEQLRASQAASRAAASSGYGLGGGGGSTAAPSIQDQAYKNVQSFLAQGRKAAESDYWATKASADRGNAMDKIKIQIYNQAGINPGQVRQYGGSTTGIPSF